MGVGKKGTWPATDEIWIMTPGFFCVRKWEIAS